MKIFDKIMENREKIRQPELKIKELMELLENIKWEYGHIFTFNGTKFYMVITEASDLTEAETKGEIGRFGEPAEFSQSTYVNGYDIYLHDTIPESERKKILFHEILEANLRDQSFSSQEAHDIATKEEEIIFGQREK